MKKICFIMIVCILSVTLLIACAAKEKDTLKDQTNTLSDEQETNEINNPESSVTQTPTDEPTPKEEPTKDEPTTEEPTTEEPTSTETPEAEIDYKNSKLVALTFDDGPNLQITPQVLDILEEYKVPASFFLIGKNISEETKPVMERTLELGCEINSHAWSHSDMSKFTADEIIEEMQKTSDKIQEMVNIEPAFFRPPFISTSPVMFDTIELPFINGINCLDWEASVTAEQRVEKILSQVKDGDIILLHDFQGNDQTVEALDDMIEALLEEGYQFVTVSQLFEYKEIDPMVKNKLWSNVG